MKGGAPARAHGHVRTLGAGTLLCVSLSLAGCAEGTETPDAQVAEAPDAGATTAYAFRLDSERSDPGAFRISEESGGVRVRTGPAGIAWREADVTQSGPFAVRATFVQYEAPVGYREAYGVFVGGRDLQGADVEYTYLLVRPTGDFLVKRRRGDTTETLVDWTAHEAVERVVEQGDEPRNTLAVEVGDGDTRFLVNGTEVHSMPTPEARPHGIVGIRANHRLDILLSDWALERRAGGAS